MSKKVLIHSLIFSPDGVSTAYLYNDIALRFQKEGYEVVVLSTTPHFTFLPKRGRTGIYLGDFENDFARRNHKARSIMFFYKRIAH